MQTTKKHDTLTKDDTELFLIMVNLKLKQMSDIVLEMLKLKKGINSHLCKLRNMLQILSGELEIHCNISITEEVREIANLLERTPSDKNWEEVSNIILCIYEKILYFCK